MHYLTALRSGVGAENVAQEFAQEIVRASSNAGELCLQITCNFVNDTLLAIGISGQITPEQVDEGKYDYQWPKEELQIYSFPYNELEFRRIEKFLVAMCHEMHQHNNVFMDNLSPQELDDELEERDSETPLELLMQLLAVWCSVYKHLLKENTWGTAKMFEEPLARINYFLFEGIHTLRKLYRDALPLLDNLCRRLYGSALQGLRYKQANDTIFLGLLKIISQDLVIFKDDAMQFFYETFTVEYSPSILKLYQELQIMLEENDGNRLTILTDILIKTEMLEIYFTTLATQQGKEVVKRQQGTLELLSILQSKLVSLDCFSRDFMEAILSLVLPNKTNTPNLACTVYVVMMKRKMSEQMILKHIMEFYVAHSNSTSQLKGYVVNFYNNFPFIRNVHHFMEIISNAGTTDIIRLLSSQVVVIVFEMLFELNESPLKEVEPVLQILPEMVENVQCQRSVGILLDLLKYVSFERLQRQTIDNIIHYGLGIFAHIENNFEYPLLMNVFNNLHKCLVVTKEWQHLELVSDHLMIQYRDMINKLGRKKAYAREVLPTDFSQHFIGVLKRINIIIKSDYEIFEFLPSIMSSLQQYVLADDAEPTLKITCSFIDLYALEICVSSIIKLAKREPTTTIATSVCFKQAQDLSYYFVKLLENIEQLLKLPAFRLKVYVCCLLNLHCHLPLPLANSTYYHITQILIALHSPPKSGPSQNVTSDEVQQMHPLLSLEYHRIIFQHFAELHKFQHVQIKSNIVWKLCIHYGKSHNKFNEELKHLLITLATHRLNIYKHINAVLIYNLYKQQPPLKSATIIMLLKKHKHLIDNEIAIDLPNLLKVHIVLVVLQIVEKALSVQKINSQHNRVEALRDLNILLDDLDLGEVEAKDLMLEQCAALRNHLMSTYELQIFKNFQRNMENF